MNLSQITAYRMQSFLKQQEKRFFCICLGVLWGSVLYNFAHPSFYPGLVGIVLWVSLIFGTWTGLTLTCTIWVEVFDQLRKRGSR